MTKRNLVASFYSSEVWDHLTADYRRFELYRRTITAWAGGFGDDDRLCGIIDTGIVAEFVDGYDKEVVNLALVLEAYGVLYFEARFFGLKSAYIERFFRRKRILLSIEGELRGRTPCHCCGYDVFLPQCSDVYAQCPLCFWLDDCVDAGYSYTNRKFVEDGRANFRLYKTSDPGFKVTCPRPDDVYFKSQPSQLDTVRAPGN